MKVATVVGSISSDGASRTTWMARMESRRYGLPLNKLLVIMLGTSTCSRARAKAAVARRASRGHAGTVGNRGTARNLAARREEEHMEKVEEKLGEKERENEQTAAKARARQVA